jgi:hypothetical protein
MTAHADMASHQSKQEQGAEAIPRSGGARSINLGTPTKWTILHSDWTHLFWLLPFVLRTNLFDAVSSLRGGWGRYRPGRESSAAGKPPRDFSNTTLPNARRRPLLHEGADTPRCRISLHAMASPCASTDGLRYRH